MRVKLQKNLTELKVVSLRGPMQPGHEKLKLKFKYPHYIIYIIHQIFIEVQQVSDLVNVSILARAKELQRFFFLKGNRRKNILLYYFFQLQMVFVHKFEKYLQFLENLYFLEFLLLPRNK